MSGHGYEAAIAGAAVVVVGAWGWLPSFLDGLASIVCRLLRADDDHSGGDDARRL